jgi:hypothetical protein
VTVFDGKQAELFGIVRVEPAPHSEYDRLRRLVLFLEGPDCRQQRWSE